MMTRWEYRTLFLEANAKLEEDFLLSMRSWKDGIPRNAPESMIPQLDSLGAEGWELVHMQPVLVGKNQDVSLPSSESGMTVWTSKYFCVFKRPST